VDVHLVVAGAVVTDEAKGARERVEEFAVNLPRHFKAVKRAVCRNAAIECARCRLFQEVSAVGGLRCEDVGNLLDRSPS
jgi:hypothetical protein